MKNEFNIQLAALRITMLRLLNVRKTETIILKAQDNTKKQMFCKKLTKKVP